MEQVMEMPPARAAGRRITRALRVLLWIALAIVLLAAALAAMVLLVNRRDQAPSKDARALEAIVASARPVAPADDALAGLAALGVAAFERIDPADPKALRDASAEDDRARRAARGARLDAALGACNARDVACARLLAAAEPDMPAWIARESELLAAYRGVLPRRGWYEAPPPVRVEDAPSPRVGKAMVGQQLLLAQVLVDAGNGRVDAVRDALDADARFWRAGLAGSRTLITKMVAARALQRNLDIGAQALQRLPVESVGAAVPPAWRQPVTTRERSLATTLAWEWKFNDNYMKHLHLDAERTRRVRDAGAPSTTWVFKPQATSNAGAARMRRIAAASEAPYGRMRGAMRQLRADVESEGRFPYSLYNPAGRILGAIAAPAYLDYATRVADLEARRRAVLAVAGLHAAGIPPADVPQALAASPHRNPYTGHPFAWDATAACVRIGGLDRIEGRGCVAYGPASNLPTPDP